MRAREVIERLEELPGDCEVIVAVPSDTYAQLYVTPYPVAACDVELDGDGQPQRAVIVASSHVATYATTVGVWYCCIECGARRYVTDGTPPPWCIRCDSYFLVP